MSALSEIQENQYTVRRVMIPSRPIRLPMDCSRFKRDSIGSNQLFRLIGNNIGATAIISGCSNPEPETGTREKRGPYRTAGLSGEQNRRVHSPVGSLPRSGGQRHVRWFGIAATTSFTLIFQPYFVVDDSAGQTAGERATAA
ncbi:hypothetical protein [Nocardia aurea]|uniref:Uncharacterized protein n=1 Tax=Nocardia aurea TaxID=2144174 RepID=A0ABV3FLD0_9NOCA